MSFTTVGEHEIIELYGCNTAKLKDQSFIRKHLELVAEKCGATVIQSNFHRFDDGGEGVTGVVMLSESHITIHTWPEHDYAAVDVFMCGNKADPTKAIEPLKEIFESDDKKVINADRGFYTEERKSIKEVNC